MKFVLALFFGILISSTHAWAIDVYSIIESSCKIHNGLVIGITPTHLEFLNLKGEYEIISRSLVNNIVIYSTIENPIEQIKVTPPLIARAKNIYINDESNPQFSGWPIRFIEDLVIFYDVTGKSHVLELSEITNIRDLTEEDTPKQYVTRDFKALNLNLSDVNSQCTDLSSHSKTGIGPTRIISDKISISEFLAVFEKGFHNLEGYQERTHFYAKPFLFEKRSKLGFLFFQQYRENTLLLPIYFQWSTGKPYRFQSFTTFGAVASHYTPMAEPFFGIQSDLKSHFFHALFVGNIVALPAGSSYYVDPGIRIPQNVSAVENINYMALMGMDYSSYSISFGTLFPIFAYQVKKDDTNTLEQREVLGSNLSPAFRLMYDRPKYLIRLLTSWSQSNGLGSDITKLKLLSSSSLKPDNFNMNGGFARADFAYKVSEELKIEIDEIFSTSNYTENWGSTQYSFNATRWTTAIQLVQSFGYYISVKGFFNIFNSKYKYVFPNDAQTTNGQDTSYGGALEFVF